MCVRGDAFVIDTPGGGGFGKTEYMTTILITGANRGIGLEFVKQYAAEGADIIACCREPAKARR